VNACAYGNPERNENANKANHAKSNATRLQANSPQGCYESVDGKKLAKCTSVKSQTGRHYSKGETHEGDQRDPNFTNLLDDALCCAIVPFVDDPVVSPPDIEDTTHGLQEIEHEEGELSRAFNEPSKWQQENCQADHVDVSRPLE
jgi:hypothetical protein